MAAPQGNRSGTKIMIRKMTSRDTDRVGEIWQETSIMAHDFVSADFWRSNLKTMTETLLPQAECYVHEVGERINGFSTVAGDSIQCLFVGNYSGSPGVAAACVERSLPRPRTQQRRGFDLGWTRTG